MKLTHVIQKLMLIAKIDNIVQGFTSDINNIFHDIERINARDILFVTQAQGIINRIEEIERFINSYDCNDVSYQINEDISSSSERSVPLRGTNSGQINETTSVDTPSSSSSNSSNSSNLPVSSLFEMIETRFKQHFNSIRTEGDTIDFTCDTVAHEIYKITKKRISGSTI